MELVVYREPVKAKATIGKLYINGCYECDTLEDMHRDTKVMHETRIPAGTYRITLRDVGGFHARYRNRFPDIHKGMLWIRDVPDFEYILIHIGNYIKDTSGCILVGKRYSDNTIINSRTTYISLYKKVIKALEDGEEVTIRIED